MEKLQAGTEEGCAAHSGLGMGGGCCGQRACPALAHREALCQVCAPWMAALRAGEPAV